mmetsp:Transcript_8620/g.10056  ORF Transcript_8620/g.10056 Transcript_8620/m.10056 type:complete len:459 (+) Transcript_8620:39-1415(+)
MNSVQTKPQMRRTTLKDRNWLSTISIFSFAVGLTVLEKSQCFVPSVLRTNPRSQISFVRLLQTEIETNKNNEGEVHKTGNLYSYLEIKNSKQKELVDAAGLLAEKVSIEKPNSFSRGTCNTQRLSPVRTKTTIINDSDDSWSKSRLIRDLRSKKNICNSISKKSFANLKLYSNGLDDDDENHLPRVSESCRELIESTVEDMLENTGSTMGLFPKAGTILARSSDSPSSSEIFSGNTIVRLATHMDDLDIADLRLSVFSNLCPDSRKIFCDRSCQLLSTRRQRGANCIIATYSCDRKDVLLHAEGKSSVIGTAEISFHEFTETRLGYARPKNSILYITEVAVDATYRRKGIAKLMLQAIDNVANSRELETIYLHVDVTNFGAVHLYEKAGYRKLVSDNPIFYEFTRKLNLHDGATKGRKHHLMAKDLSRPTWLDYPKHIDEAYSVSSEGGVLGIEIPAV